MLKLLNTRKANELLIIINLSMRSLFLGIQTVITVLGISEVRNYDSVVQLDTREPPCGWHMQY